MKSVIILLLCALLSTLSSGQAVNPVDISKILSADDYLMKVVYPATTMLYSQDSDGGMTFRCTATAIELHSSKHEGLDNYRLLSASHCLSPVPGHDGPRWLFVGHDKLDRREFFKAIVVARGNEVDDFLLLDVDLPNVPIVSLGTNPTHLDTEVSMIGATAGVGKLVLHGHVALLDLERQIAGDGIWDDDTVMIIPGAGHGASGSAVICVKQNAICAIYVGQYGDLQLTIPISRFKSWYKELKDNADPKKHK